MTRILALCGKKQSGKNTAFNFLFGLEMAKNGIVRDKFSIDDDTGELWVSDILGEKGMEGYVDVYSQNPEVKHFYNELVYPSIKNYSFADTLKETCINLLGLKPEQCYGTDEQKNSKTSLKWENMPGVTSREGFMTAREVMQFVGTEVFRKMYSDVWANSTIKKILDENSYLAVITDCRFANEVAAVKKAGGKVIRLTRAVDLNDNHDSECSLDKDRYDWKNFDAVIDNQDLTIEQTNGKIYNQLVEWGWANEVNLNENE